MAAIDVQRTVALLLDRPDVIDDITLTTPRAPPAISSRPRPPRREYEPHTLDFEAR
jgi:hypothetical protein